MEWKKEDSGLGWHRFKAEDFVIEPEDLDIGTWELWLGRAHILTGTLQECKQAAEGHSSN